MGERYRKMVKLFRWLMIGSVGFAGAIGTFFWYQPGIGRGIMWAIPLFLACLFNILETILRKKEAK